MLLEYDLLDCKHESELCDQGTVPVEIDHWVNLVVRH
jgi:hypothetical protein